MCFKLGVTRKKATLIISGVQFFHGLGMFFSAVVSKSDLSTSTYLTLMAAAIFTMFLAIVLLIGAIKCRRSLLFIWLIWAGISLMGYVLSVPFIALFLDKVIEKFGKVEFAIISTLILFVLSFFLELYCLYVVHGYYKELKAEECEEEDPKEVAENQTRPSTQKGNQVSASEIKNEVVNKIEEKY